MDIFQMKRRFGEHRLAGQCRSIQLGSELNGPAMVLVTRSRKGHQKTGVGQRLHFDEKPFRLETFEGPPLMVPANRMYGLFLSFSGVALSASSWFLTRSPMDSPVFFESP